MSKKLPEADLAMQDLIDNNFSVVTKDQHRFVVRVIKEKINDMNLLVDNTKRCFGIKCKLQAEEYFESLLIKFPGCRIELLTNTCELLMDNGVML